MPRPFEFKYLKVVRRSLMPVAEARAVSPPITDSASVSSTEQDDDSDPGVDARKLRALADYLSMFVEPAEGDTGRPGIRISGEDDGRFVIVTRRS